MEEVVNGVDSVVLVPDVPLIDLYRRMLLPTRSALESG